MRFVRTACVLLCFFRAGGETPPDKTGQKVFTRKRLSLSGYNVATERNEPSLLKLGPQESSILIVT